MPLVLSSSSESWQLTLPREKVLWPGKHRKFRKGEEIRVEKPVKVLIYLFGMPAMCGQFIMNLLHLASLLRIALLFPPHTQTGEVQKGQELTGSFRRTKLRAQALCPCVHTPSLCTVAKGQYRKAQASRSERP